MWARREAREKRRGARRIVRDPGWGAGVLEIGTREERAKSASPAAAAHGDTCLIWGCFNG